MPRLLPIAAAAAAAMALAPAAASAAGPVVSATYDVELEGVFRQSATDGAAGAFDTSRHYELGFRSVAHGVRLTKATLPATVVAATETTATSADGSLHMVVHGEPPLVQDCTYSKPASVPPGLAGVREDDGGRLRVEIEPFQTLELPRHCSIAVPSHVEELEGRMVTAVAGFDRDRIGEAQILLPVESAPSLACTPFEFLLSCDASWQGRITLTRTGIEQAPTPRPTPTPGGGGSGGSTPPPSTTTTTHTPPAADDYLYPLEPPAPAPAPAPVTTPPADDDYLTPLVPARRPTLDARRGTVTLQATCLGGCAGTATGRAGGRRVRAGFRVAAGPTAQRVVVRLPGAQARRLRGARKATVVVALRDLGTGRRIRTTLAARVAR